MTEFGHVGIIGAIFCADSWGAGPFAITLNGKTWLFEDSDRFGPRFVNMDGSESKSEPGEKSPFWRGYSLWRNQGRQLQGDGKTGTWKEPLPHMVRIQGREIITVSEGEEDGLMINIETGSVIHD